MDQEIVLILIINWWFCCVDVNIGCKTPFPCYIFCTDLLALGAHRQNRHEEHATIDARQFTQIHLPLCHIAP